MRSNFKSPLTIVRGAVQTGGRLNWEGGETEALVSVSISQKNEAVAGMATSPSRFTKDKDKEWKLPIRPGYSKQSGYRKKFEPGPAQAVGIVCAMGDEVRVFFWSQEVQLKKG